MVSIHLGVFSFSFNKSKCKFSNTYIQNSIYATSSAFARIEERGDQLSYFNFWIILIAFNLMNYSLFEVETPFCTSGISSICFKALKEHWNQEESFSSLTIVKEIRYRPFDVICFWYSSYLGILCLNIPWFLIVNILLQK